MNKQQKYVSITKGMLPWIMGAGGGDSYLFSQCHGNSGLEKDLNSGWFVKHIFEDEYCVVILLEVKTS